MKMMMILSLALWAQVSFAVGFEGEITFTSSEVAKHQSSIQELTDVAANCLKSDLKRHRDFYAKYGISAFYGDRSQFAKMSRDQKQSALKRLGLSPKLLDQMAPTSCVGLTLKCLEQGFKATNQSSTWEKLKTYTKKNAQDGTALQNGLQKLGWTLLYWNPAPEHNERWDEIEKRDDRDNSSRFWGYHSYRYLTVSREMRYYFNKVDDAKWLVGFQTSVPAQFSDIPFFVGTAHTGYHVFPGMYGRVIEGHSTRSITDAQTLESSPFNPLQNGGGPRGAYRSGLMLVPPGYY